MSYKSNSNQTCLKQWQTSRLASQSLFWLLRDSEGFISETCKVVPCLRLESRATRQVYHKNGAFDAVFEHYLRRKLIKSYNQLNKLNKIQKRHNYLKDRQSPPTLSHNPTPIQLHRQTFTKKFPPRKMSTFYQHTRGCKAKQHQKRSRIIFSLFLWLTSSLYLAPYLLKSTEGQLINKFNTNDVGFFTSQIPPTQLDLCTNIAELSDNLLNNGCSPTHYLITGGSNFEFQITFTNSHKIGTLLLIKRYRSIQTQGDVIVYNGPTMIINQKLDVFLEGAIDINSSMYDATHISLIVKSHNLPSSALANNYSEIRIFSEREVTLIRPLPTVVLCGSCVHQQGPTPISLVGPATLYQSDLPTTITFSSSGYGPWVTIIFDRPYNIAQVMFASSTYQQVRLYLLDDAWQNLHITGSDYLQNRLITSQVPATVSVVQAVYYIRMQDWSPGPLEVFDIFIFERYACVNTLVFYEESPGTLQYFQNAITWEVILNQGTYPATQVFKRDYTLDDCQDYRVAYQILDSNDDPITNQYWPFQFQLQTAGNQNTKRFSLETSAVTGGGTHDFKISFSLIDINGNTISSINSVFDVTVTISECTQAEPQLFSISDFSVTVHEAEISSPTYPNPVYSTSASPQNCGSFKLELTSQLDPQILQVMNLQTNASYFYFQGLSSSNQDTGIYTLSLKISLLNHPSATPFYIDFTLTVIQSCLVTLINETGYQIQDQTTRLFDNFTFQIQGATSSDSYCPDLSFQIVNPVSNPGLISLIQTNLSISPPQLDIYSSPTQLSQIGIHPIILRIQNLNEPSATAIDIPFHLFILGCTDTLLDPITLVDMTFKVENGLHDRIQSFATPQNLNHVSRCDDGPYTYEILGYNYSGSFVRVEDQILGMPPQIVISDPSTASVPLNPNDTILTLTLEIWYTNYLYLIPPYQTTFQFEYFDCTNAMASDPHVIFFDTTTAYQNIFDSENVPLNIPLQRSVPFDCGPLHYELVENYDFLKIVIDSQGDQFIKLDPNQRQHEGTWSVTLVAQLDQYPQAQPTLLTTVDVHGNPFNQITIVNPCANTKKPSVEIQDMTFLFGSQEPTIQTLWLESQTIQEQGQPNCGDLYYSLFCVSCPSQANFLELNQISQNNHQLVLEAIDYADVGSYEFQVQPGLVTFPWTNIEGIRFNAYILPPTPRSPPRFEPTLEQIFELERQVDQGFLLPKKSWSYTLPLIKDNDADEIVTLTVDIREIENFGTYDEVSKTISIKNLNDSKVKVGTYEVKVELTDGLFVQNQIIIINIDYGFTLLVKDEENSDKDEKESGVNSNVADSEFEELGLETQQVYQEINGELFSWTYPIVSKEDKEPPKLILHSLTMSGNLTIQFTKPIRVPIIFRDLIFDKKDSGYNYAIGKERSLDSNANFNSFYYLKDIIKINLLNSDDYDSNAQIPAVVSYNVTKFNENFLDLQILWEFPEQITPNFAQPDQLQVKFISNTMFVDKFDFMHLQAQDSQLIIDVIPQVDPEEMGILSQIKQSLFEVAKAFSAFQMFLLTILGSALKYLWLLINMLQFQIFMLKWRIRIPYKTLVCLQVLKAIALFEFVPKKWFTDTLTDFIGFKKSQIGSEDYELVNPDVNTSQNASLKTNIVENMGMMLLIAFLILLILIILLLLKVVVYRDYRIFRLYMTIKQRLFYNTFLRYTLQSTLKLQIASIDTILAHWSLFADNPSSQSSSISEEDSSKKLNWTKMVVPFLIIVLLNVLPFVYLHILRRHRDILAYLPMQRQYGTLYLGLDPQRGNVEWSSFVFFIRRSFFVLLTFGLIAYPGIQLLLFSCSTLIYLAIINQMTYYAQKSILSLENFNEFIFLQICYLFILFCNLLPDENTKEIVGYWLLALLVILLATNTLCMLYQSFTMPFRKLKLRYVRYNYQKKMAVQREEKRLKEARLAETLKPGDSSKQTQSNSSSQSDPRLLRGRPAGDWRKAVILERTQIQLSKIKEQEEEEISKSKFCSQQERLESSSGLLTSESSCSKYDGSEQESQSSSFVSIYESSSSRVKSSPSQVAESSQPQAKRIPSQKEEKIVLRNQIIYENFGRKDKIAGQSSQIIDNDLVSRKKAPIATLDPYQLYPDLKQNALKRRYDQQMAKKSVKAKKSSKVIRADFDSEDLDEKHSSDETDSHRSGTDHLQLHQPNDQHTNLNFKQARNEKSVKSFERGNIVIETVLKRKSAKDDQDPNNYEHHSWITQVKAKRETAGVGLLKGILKSKINKDMNQREQLRGARKQQIHVKMDNEQRRHQQYTQNQLMQKRAKIIQEFQEPHEQRKIANDKFVDQFFPTPDYLKPKKDQDESM